MTGSTAASVWKPRLPRTRSVRLGAWYRLIAACLRGVYFTRVRIAGELPSHGARPRLILASHRNGAVDGLVVQAAFPDAQYLVSQQLLRNPILRLLFTGIPVVRKRDIERHGLDPARFADPVTASARHLAAGGDLVIFPEGTSHWGSGPGEYRNGAARIWCRLKDEGIAVEVVPVGLFYSAPDRFRSLAEIHCGAAAELAAPGTEDRAAREREVHAAMSKALDAVSVHCRDAETFNRVQSQAVAQARSGASLAQSFLHLQRVADGSVRETPEAAKPEASPRWPRQFGLALMWLVAPVLLTGWFAGRRADARNTVTFFRLLASAAVSLFWIPLLLLAAWHWPALVLLGAGCAGAGWWILGIRRWQPDSAPLSHSPAMTPDEGNLHD